MQDRYKSTHNPNAPRDLLDKEGFVPTCCLFWCKCTMYHGPETYSLQWAQRSRHELFSVRILISESTYALAAIIIMLSAGKPRKRPFGKIQNIYLATPSEPHVCCKLMSGSLWLWKIHYGRKTNTALYSKATTYAFAAQDKRNLLLPGRKRTQWPDSRDVAGWLSSFVPQINNKIIRQVNIPGKLPSDSKLIFRAVG